MWLSHITSSTSELHELKNTDKTWRLKDSSSSASDTIPTDKHTHTTRTRQEGNNTKGFNLCNCALHMSIERERQTYWSNHITALARIADRCHPFLGAGLTLARIADG